MLMKKIKNIKWNPIEDSQNKISVESNIEKIIPKYNKTLSGRYSECNQKHNNSRKKNILFFSNPTLNQKDSTNSQDKLIQTPSHFYASENKINLKRECMPYIKNSSIKIIDEPNHKTFDSCLNKYNKHICDLQRIVFGKKLTLIPNKFYNTFGKLKDMKHSRNRIYPTILYNNKQKTGEETCLKNSLKYNTMSEKRKNHHNLFTIENLYFQRRNSEIEKSQKIIINNKMKSLLHKKYSIKEIKYRQGNKIDKKYNVIDDDNEHLLEEIFKRQTLSNFNNKYNVRFKTNNKTKKENITNLFSLLKKYKYSDEDKQTAFNKYNSMKKIRNTVNI